MIIIQIILGLFAIVAYAIAFLFGALIFLVVIFNLNKGINLNRLAVVMMIDAFFWIIATLLLLATVQLNPDVHVQSVPEGFFDN